MSKMRLKKRKKVKYKKGNVVLIIIIMIIVGIVTLMSCLGNYFGSSLILYAEDETRKMATQIINNSLTSSISTKIDSDELFNITKGEKGDINSIELNSSLSNVIIRELVNQIQTNLRLLEEGDTANLQIPNNIKEEFKDKGQKQGAIFQITVLSVFNNPFLANMGPKIPVRMALVGTVEGNLETKINSYGINNSLIEVYAKIIVKIRLHLPLTSDLIEIETKIPLTMKIIQGQVPYFYNHTGNASMPIFSFPIE